jgi:uncharacterized protein
MPQLRDDKVAGRFELEEESGTSFANYRRAEGRLLIDHVEAPVALRGTGAAGRLMDAIVAQAQLEDRQIIPLCSYAAVWMKRRFG